MFLDREGTGVYRNAKYLNVGHVRSPGATDGETQQLSDDASDVHCGEAEEVELVEARYDYCPAQPNYPRAKGRHGQRWVVSISDSYKVVE